MSQHVIEQIDTWIGRMLIDEAGHKIGKVADVYTDDDTGQPEWFAVTTGLFGSNVSFVPLKGASPGGDGLQVPFPKDQVKDAPNAGADGKLSEEEVARLYGHYGLDYDQERVRLQRWAESDGAETPRPVDHDGERGERESIVDSRDRRPLTGPEPGDAEHQVSPYDSAAYPEPADRGDTVGPHPGTDPRRERFEDEGDFRRR